MAKRVVDVLVPVALDQAYSYRVPEGLALAPGDLVTVPLGPRAATAVVWAENSTPNPRLDNRMKDVEDKLDAPAAQAGAAQIRGLGVGLHAQPARHGAAHGAAHGRASRPRARARRRAACRAGAEAHDAGAQPRAGAARRRARARQERAGARRRRLAGRDRRPPRRGDAGKPGAAARAGGARARSGLSRDPTSRRPSARRRRRCARRVAKGGYGVTLLDGVTGSGKTQVYFEAVSEVIRRGKQALVLLPEIALTTQFLDRFVERFGVRPAEWHSQLSPAPARAHLERGRGRRGRRHRRRPLGAVPALCRSRAHRRR